jgi:hypothetical protein
MEYRHTSRDGLACLANHLRSTRRLDLGRFQGVPVLEGQIRPVVAELSATPPWTLGRGKFAGGKEPEALLIAGEAQTSGSNLL